ncbi:MAG: radical SAM family heme chaperone HemW [Candidatus Nanopelagicaceae bacterium]
MAKVERPRSSARTALSLYIHIPYCSKRCGYCDFNTYTPQELNSHNLALITTPYIDSVLKELELAAERTGGGIVPSIFFGGGTPSLMPAAEIGRIMKKITEVFELEKDVEVTLEANPDTLSRAYLDQLVVAGINRISIGMQSAVPHVLSALDRTHDPDNVIKACELVRAAGINRLSVDLIYGVPGESISDWQKTYQAALELPIEHVSAYALIVEIGTKLAARIKRGELVMPPDDETAEKYLLFDDAAEERGFNWYELSNWSKEGGACRHNISYWNGSYWWGIGPGAHSYLNGKRWWNVQHPNTYQSALQNGDSPEASSEQLTESNLRDEFVMLQIRMREGIPLNRLSKEELNKVEKFRESGHLEGDSWEAGNLILSRTGRLIADRIVREMLV